MHIQGPSDDGSCPAHTTEAECLKRESMFDTTNTYCAWDWETDSCAYKKASFSLTVSCATFPFIVLDFVVCYD